MRSRYFPLLITLTMLSYMVANYLPVTQKTINNLFYVGVALPCLAWLLFSVRAAPVFFRTFVIVLLPLTLLTLWNIREPAELRHVLYMLALLAGCVVIEQRPAGMVRLYTAFSVFSLVFFAWVVCDWLLIYLRTGIFIRYASVNDVWLNPIYAALLISSAMVFLWLFHFDEKLATRSAHYHRIGFVLLALGILVCATVFQARTALIGFGLFFVLYLASRRLWLLGSLSVFVLAVGTWGLGLERLLAVRGLSYRPQIWQDVWRRLVDECGLLQGCGYDGYLFLGQYTQAHNSYLGMLYAEGLVGVIPIVVLFGWLCWHGLRSGSKWFQLALIGAGGLLTTSGGIISSPNPYWIYFWIPIFMTIIDVKRTSLENYFSARRNAQFCSGIS